MELGEQEAVEHLINMLNHIMLRNSIHKELQELEDELYTKNRFSPKTNLLKSIDNILPTSTRIIKARTILYRARTIPRQSEYCFLKPVYKALNDFLGKEGDLDPMLFDELFLQNLIDDITTGVRKLDYNELRRNLQAFKNKGWWGYSFPESGAPPASMASNNRLSPFGISYLYAAGDKTTAALEVRSSPTQLLSIAEVELSEDVTLFDLTRSAKPSEPYDERNSLFKELLSNYYSRPNISGDQSYLLTQYVSEYVKNLPVDGCKPSYDGICYNSSLKPDGVDYVLFDTGEAKKYKILSSSVERMQNIAGKLATILPMKDETILFIVNWPS